jgi:hypothetical protein
MTLSKVFSVLNHYMWGELTDKEYDRAKEAMDELAAMQKRISQYEDFLHAINYAVVAGNSERVKALIDNAFKWGYAHRAGNGEYTDEEQQRLIDKCAESLTKVPDANG